MIKVKTKAPFETKSHRVICKEPGEIILMPDEDYEEVKDLCEVIKEKSTKGKSSSEGLSINVSEEV